VALFGYDQGVFSGVVISEDYLTVHNLLGDEKTSLLSIITSIYAIGCFLGGMFGLARGWEFITSVYARQMIEYSRS
jgi:hypothetical protein